MIQMSEPCINRSSVREVQPTRQIYVALHPERVDSVVTSTTATL